MIISNDSIVFEQSDIDQLSPGLRDALAIYAGDRITPAEFLNVFIADALKAAVAHSDATISAVVADKFLKLSLEDRQAVVDILDGEEVNVVVEPVVEGGAAEPEPAPTAPVPWYKKILGLS